MDEGEASCLSLNINVGELQSITTMVVVVKENHLLFHIYKNVL